MDVIPTVADLRQRRLELTGPVALVPTMGALHEGHLALIRRAREIANHVIVSIFVNPTQFGPGEDLDRYPRTLDADLASCQELEVDLVFAPAIEQMYPAEQVDTAIDVPALTTILEGAQRPGHFAGVCRVCAKLFNMTQPDVACFGQKDYQQLAVIDAMVRDLAMPVTIESVATVREPDGLALSSRNRYLGDEQRSHALGLIKALRQAKMLVEDEGETDPIAVEQAMTETMTAHRLDVDYAAVRHPQTLAELDIIEPSLTGGVVALVAARLGGVRLIDNMQLALD